jgi:non-heme chloroperoxidase
LYFEELALRDAVRMTTALTARESEEVERANASGLPPIVFIHGLWLSPDSWSPWRELFESRGYTTLAPGWPDEMSTIEAARSNASALANKGVVDITDHHAGIIERLTIKPAIVGHSFGGLIAQKLAGYGHSSVTVAIDPAPFRGVLSLPFSALKAAFPALKSPGNRNKTVMLTYKQFRFAFANVVGETEAKELYDKYAVPAPARPLFQAATANFNPHAETSVDTKAAERGPLLIVEGSEDNTVPWAVANAEYKLQKKNPSNTEIHKIPGRGHSLVIDSGWRDVAEVTHEFFRRNWSCVPATAPRS